MNSQQLVRDLFELPQKENIYDDFGCAWQKTAVIQGRMYITESFICFSSNILGMEQKLRVPIIDIKKILKKKVLGLFNSALEIITIDQTLNFCSFQDRDLAYERIFALYKVSSPYAKISQIEEDPENAEYRSEAKIKKSLTLETPKVQDNQFKQKNLDKKLDSRLQQSTQSKSKSRLSQKSIDMKKSKTPRPNHPEIKSLKSDTPTPHNPNHSSLEGFNINGRKTFTDKDNNSSCMSDNMDKMFLSLQQEPSLDKDLSNYYKKLELRNRMSFHEGDLTKDAKGQKRVKILDEDGQFGGFFKDGEGNQSLTIQQSDQQMFQDINKQEIKILVNHNSRSSNLKRALSVQVQNNELPFDRDLRKLDSGNNIQILEQVIESQLEYNVSLPQYKLDEIAEVSDQELEQLMQKEFVGKDKPQLSFDLGQKIFGLSLDEFYEMTLKSDGKLSMQYYYQQKGYKDLKVETIKADSDKIESYLISFVLPITGVPFVKSSRVTKLVTINRQDKQEVLIINQFTILEIRFMLFKKVRHQTCPMAIISIIMRFGLYSLLLMAQKGLFQSNEIKVLSIFYRAQDNVVFVKNTIFKSKIYARSEIEFKLYFQDLLNLYEKSGFLSQESIQQMRKFKEDQIIKDQKVDQSIQEVKQETKQQSQEVKLKPKIIIDEVMFDSQQYQSNNIKESKFIHGASSFYKQSIVEQQQVERLSQGQQIKEQASLVNPETQINQRIQRYFTIERILLAFIAIFALVILWINIQLYQEVGYIRTEMNVLVAEIMKINQNRNQ
eukprot:403366896